MSVPFNRFAAFADLTVAEQQALQELTGGPRFSYARGDAIRFEQEPVDRLYFLVSGWALTCGSLANGGRQNLKIHLPGDIMGAPSIALERSAEGIFAATDVTVCVIPLAKLSNVFTRLPRLAMLFFMAAQEEWVILMDRLLAAGRSSAKEALAALLIYLHERLLSPDKIPPSYFFLPLSQADIADYLGLHVVHVGRMFKALEDEGLISRDIRAVTLLDVERLRALSGIPARLLSRCASWLPPEI